jgi:transcription antitermination factor NusG
MPESIRGKRPTNEGQLWLAHRPAKEERLWFALQTKSHHEKTSAVALRNRGYEEFLPVYYSRHRWSDRVKVLSLPLFPGYVFCRFAPTQQSLVLDTPGVYGIVSVGRTPAPIDEDEVAALQTMIHSHAAAEPWPFLHAGDNVRIEEGPLRGLQGILIQTKQQHRIVLSVTLLQRSVAVEVDRSWVELAT